MLEYGIVDRLGYFYYGIGESGFAEFTKDIKLAKRFKNKSEAEWMISAIEGLGVILVSYFHLDFQPYLS